MKQYLELIERVLNEGVKKEDRTGTGTISVFGHQMRFDLSEGFPLLTTKKMFTRGIIEELLWFISGSTNKKVLQEKNVHIWDAWGDDETGELGPIYGHQWRAWQDYNGGSIDQLMQAVETIKKNPDSRRIIVCSWNVAQIDQMGLPPCHCFFQFYVADGKLSLQLYQRSADIFLGVPFNIASYALLLMMMAQVSGLEVGEFVHVIADAHIYDRHIPAIRELISREPLPAPTFWINPEIKNFYDFTLDDFVFEDTCPLPQVAEEPFIARCCRAERSGIGIYNGKFGAVVHWGSSPRVMLEAVDTMLAAWRKKKEEGSVHG